MDAGSVDTGSLASSASTASMAGSSSTASMARSGRTGEITGRRVRLSVAGQAPREIAPHAYACGNSSGPRADEKSLRHFVGTYSPRLELDEGKHLRGLPDCTFHQANKVEQEKEEE